MFFFIFLFSNRSNGTVKFLTKGDNNSVDDRGLYAPGQLWLTKKDIVGRARGFLPYVGMITIYMNEYPNLKVTFNFLIYIYAKTLKKYTFLFPVRYIGYISNICIIA